MCVVSMIMEQKYDDWTKRYPYPFTQPLTIPDTNAPPFIVPLPTKTEIEEFRRLLDRARQYDKDHNQPDCELEEKRTKIKNLAKELGVEINFV